MKITKTYLRQVIKEELDHVLNELSSKKAMDAAVWDEKKLQEVEAQLAAYEKLAKEAATHIATWGGAKGELKYPGKGTIPVKTLPRKMYEVMRTQVLAKLHKSVEHKNVIKLLEKMAAYAYYKDPKTSPLHKLAYDAMAVPPAYLDSAKDIFKNRKLNYLDLRDIDLSSLKKEDFNGTNFLGFLRDDSTKLPVWWPKPRWVGNNFPVVWGRNPPEDHTDVPDKAAYASRNVDDPAFVIPVAGEGPKR